MKSGMEAYRVLIVEDDQGVRQSLIWTLNAAAYRAETCETARDCIASLDQSTPTCVLVDLLLPGMTGMALCRELATRSNCAFVIVSGHGEISAVVEAMKLGAVDFIEKPFPQQRLIEAVGAAIDAASRRMREFREEESAFERLAALSERERQVFDAMTAGLVTKQIAARLSISPKTVDVHRSNISRKLQLTSVAQLAHFLAIFHRREARRRSA